MRLAAGQGIRADTGVSCRWGRVIKVGEYIGVQYFSTIIAMSTMNLGETPPIDKM